MTKNPLVINPFEDTDFESAQNTQESKEVKEEKFSVDTEKVQESVENIEKDIPSCYIAIKLPSNGKVEGIPEVLHFRDYSGSDALDLNVLDDDESIKTLVNVLKRMCYENFDIGLLPVNDVLYILYILQFTFISPEITKPIYLNENLPEDELEDENNIEEVTIPFSAIKLNYLGKDENDKNLSENVKFPLTLTDKQTNTKIRVKLASLKDTLIARDYCKKFYKDKFIEFGNVRKQLSDIQNIKKRDIREQKMNEFLINNEDEVNSYYSFMSEYALTVAKFIQAMQIVAYNDENIEDIERKWELYQNNISSNIWEFYNTILEKYSFGLNEKVEVFSTKLNKKVTRRVSFQLSDFLSFNRQKGTDRFDLSFD